MHFPRTIRIIAACLLGFSHAQAMQVTQGAPEGFERLAEPRPTFVNLYYSGDLLGRFPAHFTPTHLQFDTPDAVLQALEDVKPTAALREALAAPLPANAHALCKPRRPGCGQLAPDAAGVIFDETTLAAELFVANPYRRLQGSGERYLPVPKDAPFSSVHAFTGAVAGTDNDIYFNGTANGIYSLGEARLTTQSSLSNEGLRFDTAAASIEREGWEASAGLFRSRPMQLIADRDIAGVSFTSSTRTLRDKYKSAGNDIILYLPRRAYVSLYREGRLYSARAYEAGNQVIDTSELPDGAYNVTLRIQESGGDLREEQRFFAKSGDMPASGEPVYYLQAGVIREPAAADDTIPRFTGDPLLRAGYGARIGDNTGAGIGLLGLRDRAALEANAFWLGEGMQLSAAAMASSKGDAGVQATYIYTDERLSATFDARKVWMSSGPMAGYDMLVSDITQATAIVAYALHSDVSVGARASYSAYDGYETMTAGPYAEWRIWQENESMFGLSASVARTDGENEGNLLLSFTHRFGEANDYGLSSTLGHGYGGMSRGINGTTRVFHERIDGPETLRLGGGMSADTRSQTLSADADWRGRMGQLQGSIQRSFGDAQAFGYAANVAINAAQQGGNLHIGGNANERSAIVVTASGDADSELRILVNDAELGRVAPGASQAVYLSPYQSYRVRVVPTKPELLAYDTAERKVTLYPGNVVDMHYKLDRFHVVSARIVRADGTSLSDALLEGSNQAVSTDAKGYLQAEIRASRRSFVLEKDGVRCRVRLPAIDAKNGVLLYREPLPCR